MAATLKRISTPTGYRYQADGKFISEADYKRRKGARKSSSKPSTAVAKRKSSAPAKRKSSAPAKPRKSQKMTTADVMKALGLGGTSAAVTLVGGKVARISARVDDFARERPFIFAALEAGAGFSTTAGGAWVVKKFITKNGVMVAELVAIGAGAVGAAFAAPVAPFVKKGVNKLINAIRPGAAPVPPSGAPKQLQGGPAASVRRPTSNRLRAV